MKTKSKILLLMLCAVALVAASVLGTLAYLTSTDTVTNTFTVGKVQIKLDEAEVDAMGEPVEASNGRVKANSYKLLPGHEYVKDPTVHVDADSESCWVFVVVDNQIANLEARATEKMANGTDYVPINDQIVAKGWALISADSNVYLYYKEYTKGQADNDLEVFSNFMISGAVTGDTLAEYAPITTGEGEAAVTTYKSIVVTAYAVQKDGFDTAADAWDATFGAQSQN